MNCLLQLAYSHLALFLQLCPRAGKDRRTTSEKPRKLINSQTDNSVSENIFLHKAFTRKTKRMLCGADPYLVS